MPRIERHADHDPDLICRPAGYGLCEIWTARQPADAADPEQEAP